MKFSIRDLLWFMLCVALVGGLLQQNRQHQAQLEALTAEIQSVQRQSEKYAAAAQRNRRTANQIAHRAGVRQREQQEEILELRELIKGSLHDRREWFALQVDSNRIVAIGPGTTSSKKVTARTVDRVERATGLDGGRLRHFLGVPTSFEQLPRGQGTVQ